MKKIQFIQDTQGIAFSMYIILIAIGLFAIAYIMLSEGLNLIIPTFNEHFIDTGIASEQTKETLEFQLTIWKALPVFVAISVLFISAIVNALLKKNIGGD